MALLFVCLLFLSQSWNVFPNNNSHLSLTGVLNGRWRAAVTQVVNQINKQSRSEWRADRQSSHPALISIDEHDWWDLWHWWSVWVGPQSDEGDSSDQSELRVGRCGDLCSDESTRRRLKTVSKREKTNLRGISEHSRWIYSALRCVMRCASRRCPVRGNVKPFACFANGFLLFLCLSWPNAFSWCTWAFCLRRAHCNLISFWRKCLYIAFDI